MPGVILISSVIFHSNNSASRLIEPYLEKGPTAFFSPEETQMGCQKLKAFCMGLTSNVRKQLNETRIKSCGI